MNKVYWKWKRDRKGIMPNWVKERIDEKYLSDEFCGQLFYCEYGHPNKKKSINTNDPNIQNKINCPWIKFELFAHPKAQVQTLPKDSSQAILTLYQGKVGNIISQNECDHEKWDPLYHQPLKLPPLKTNKLWQMVDSETKDLSNAEKIQNYKTTIHLNPSLSEIEKEGLLNEASTQKFRRQVGYHSKKEMKEDFDLSSLITNKYTSIVQFKNSLDDKEQTVYISMFSKK